MASGDGKKVPRLDDLEHKSIDESDYKHKLKEQQLRILKLQRQLGESKRSVIVVFEGPDAAGKGGAIKRLLERLDPRLVRVYSVIKPTAEEYQHHYMWRFWNKLPAYGHTAVLDRSWYGRVLVERVEGFATDHEWKRAYRRRSTTSLKKTLADDNAIIIKFYLHISARTSSLCASSGGKLIPTSTGRSAHEDWRNRKKWDRSTMRLRMDMFEKTLHGYRTVAHRRGQLQMVCAAEGGKDRGGPAGKIRFEINARAGTTRICGCFVSRALRGSGGPYPAPAVFVRRLRPGFPGSLEAPPSIPPIENTTRGDYSSAIQYYEGALDGTADTADVHYKMALLFDDKLKNPLAATLSLPALPRPAARRSRMRRKCAISSSRTT